MTTLTRARFFLYLCAIFIVARVAANIGDGDHANKLQLPESQPNDSRLREKIIAFMKGGVEKEIDAGDYDLEGVIGYAKSLLGTPHVMGGYSASGLDCSGLVKLAHAKYGVELPRSSHEQGRYGKIIAARQDLRRGDLVFFHSTYKKRQLITHSGIYLGGNKFIHTSTSHGVSISTLFDSGYWQNHYLFATRLGD